MLYVERSENMAMMLGGLGSILLNEIGKIAMDTAPVFGGIAKGALVDVAKNTADSFLDEHPKFSDFVHSTFGFNRFNPRKTMMHRGYKQRRIAGSH